MGAVCQFSMIEISCWRLFLYFGGEVWEGIWNKTHWVVLNFWLERLHHVTISHDKALLNRLCQWPELIRAYRTVNFCNRDNSRRMESLRIDVGSEFKLSHPMHNNVYIYSFKAVLESGTSQLAARWLNHSHTKSSLFWDILFLGRNFH